MQVINLFGGPGAGKSTAAALLFGKMKQAHIRCELVSEYAKLATWRGDSYALADQLYITAKQNFALEVLRGQVDYVIVDSPLILAIRYRKPDFLPKTFDAMAMELFRSYTNHNYFLIRNHAYDPIGRNQTQQEAESLDGDLRKLLEAYTIPYLEVPSDEKVADVIYQDLFGKSA